MDGRQLGVVVGRLYMYISCVCVRLCNVTKAEWWGLKVFMFVLRLQSPKMSVSYVHLTMCGITLGRAGRQGGHGPSGEGGVGLMGKKGVAPGWCMS